MAINPFALTPWFYKDSGRWKQEEDAMKESFPNFVLGERPHPYLYRFWRGSLHPLYPGASIQLIAAHLKAKKALHVVNNTGALVPHNMSLKELVIPYEESLYVPYEIEVIYNEPPQLPDVYIINPRVDEQTFPNHPHLRRGYRHPIGLTRSAACVIAPHDGVWTWQTSTGMQLIQLTSIWLACHILWTQIDKWLGPQASHDRETLYRTIRPDDLCHCSSGKKYGDCCRNYDKILLDGRS
jgi:hypothetical protein